MTERLPREIAVSAAWNSGGFGDDLVTVDGESLKVIHRGRWSHGLGPDFRDALILFNDHELRSGSVEIHLHSQSWFDHHHHLDPAYTDVILHVVARDDGAQARRSDGALVPTVVIAAAADLEMPDFATWEWDRVGGKVCAERVATARPQALRDVLRQLGDVRLSMRTARMEALLTIAPPAEVLWGELLVGLGFSSNREPMLALSQRVTLASLEALLQSCATDERHAAARGILFGAGGFLPLSPAESHLARLSADDVSRLEQAWRTRGTPWTHDTISASRWQRARVRPANHPVARLLAAADLVAIASGHGGTLAAITELLLADQDPVRAFCALTGQHPGASLGPDRALDILCSGIIPFSLAFAAHTGDEPLAQSATRHWDRLPAPTPNAVVRRAAHQVAGAAPVGRIGARGSQGLIHLDTTLCQPRRCFECPIAAAELSVNG